MSFDEVLAGLQKRFGQEAIMRVGDNPAGVKTISSGSLTLDMALGGGLPVGRIIEVYGPESCMDADTFIQYNVVRPDGSRANHKGGTIKHLYERFHQKPKKGKGYYQRNATKDAIFTVPSIDHNGSIFHNLVVDVVKTGMKECFDVVAGNNKVTCTADHKFYVGGEYVRLGDLKVGDVVYVHNNIRYRAKDNNVSYRSEVYVKYHPSNRIKVVDGKYHYYRVRRSHAVLESVTNGYTFNDYIGILNNESKEFIDSLWTIPAGMHVHHIDGDRSNNNANNLKIVDPSYHGKLHTGAVPRNLSFVVVPETILSIEPVGVRETYDIKCYAPHNNYIANNFVVHNSGKTTLCLHAIAEAQKLGGNCAFIDMEHALDIYYAKALGVDIANLAVSQPDNGEMALELVEGLVRSGEVSVIVIDSVAALVPIRELEGDMGDAVMGAQARLMSQALRKISGVVSKTGSTVIFTNQIRHKIGGYGNQLYVN